MMDFQAVIDEAHRRAQVVVEQACEAALQGGEHGVRVVWNGDGTVTAEVHPDVPYGEIHEYPHGCRPA